MPATKEGILVRCWVFPGNTADASTVEQVKQDLHGWKLERVVLVADRGMSSKENLQLLHQEGGTVHHRGAHALWGSGGGGSARQAG